MQTTSATWKQLWAAGAPLEARAMIAGTEIPLAAAPVITRAAMQNRLSVGNVASASLSLAVRTNGTIPRSAAVAVEARLNDGATASEWLSMGAFYISRRSRDPVTGVTALECYDALLKANAVWTPSTGAWPRTMAAVLAELLTLLGMTLDSRTVIPSGLSFVIGQPAEGATIRDVLGTIAQAGGGNWIVTPEGKLRLLPLVDSAGAGEATEDVLDVTGVVGGMGVVQAGTITGVRCTADGSVTLIGDDTGIVVDMSLAPLTAADMADMLIGQRYQAYALTGAVCDPAAELGDFVRAGANGEIASVQYCTRIALGPACRGDIAAPEAGEVTDEYPYIGGSVKTLALAKAYVNQAVGALDGELTQQEIFNRLTDNGAAQGLVMLNNQLYINASYINAGSLNVGYINFNDPGAHYDVPNENDPSTLLDGQSVSGGWIVNTSGSGYIRLIQCDYAVPLRGMTVSVTFTYNVWRDGSQTMENDGIDYWTYITSDAMEEQVFSGWFHIPETQNPFTHQFTVPNDANAFWIQVNCTGVKAISVSLSGTVVPADDINFTYAGLDVGSFLLDRDGNIITEGASIFKGAASFVKARIRELIMSAPLPVASGGTGASTAAGARANLGIAPVSEGFDVAMASSITDGDIVQENYYDPIQGLVYLKIRLYSPSGLIPTANNIIATVPQKYRPSQTHQLGPALVCKIGGFQPPNVEWCYISSDGTIRLNNFIYGPQTTTVFLISTLYPLI